MVFTVALTQNYYSFEIAKSGFLVMDFSAKSVRQSILSVVQKISLKTIAAGQFLEKELVCELKTLFSKYSGNGCLSENSKRNLSYQSLFASIDVLYHERSKSIEKVT